MNHSARDKDTIIGPLTALAFSLHRRTDERAAAVCDAAVAEIKRLREMEAAVKWAAEYAQPELTREERAKAFCAYLGGYLADGWPELAGAIDSRVFQWVPVGERI